MHTIGLSASNPLPQSTTYSVTPMGYDPGQLALLRRLYHNHTCMTWFQVTMEERHHGLGQLVPLPHPNSGTKPRSNAFPTHFAHHHSP